MRGNAASPRRFFVPGGRCGAWSRRRADQKTTAALESAVKSGNRALNEVQRLRNQRSILARHVGLLMDRVRIAQQLIEALEKSGNDIACDSSELRRTLHSREEEIEMLRVEISELAATARRHKDAMEKDANSILEESWELAKRLRGANHEIERLKRQRLVLVGHMRTARATVTEWRAYMYEFAEAIDSPLLGLQAMAALIQRGIKWAWKQIQRISLVPWVGWRGSYEVQEQLDA